MGANGITNQLAAAPVTPIRHLTSASKHFARLANSMTNHPNRGKRTRRSNPSPATIKRARELSGLTLEQCAALIHTTYRTWLQWELSPDKPQHRRCHPGMFELFLIKTKLQDHPELDQDLL